MQHDVDTDHAADYLARAGDVLAEILGNVLASIEDGTADDRAEARNSARDAILTWHRLRVKVHPRLP